MQYVVKNAPFLQKWKKKEINKWIKIGLNSSVQDIPDEMHADKAPLFRCLLIFEEIGLP